MNIIQTFKSKRSSDTEKFKSLSAEIHLALNEGFTMDNQCKKKEAMKAYSVAIDLMMYAIDRFPLGETSSNQLKTLIMKYKTRINYLDLLEDPQERKKSNKYLTFLPEPDVQPTAPPEINEPDVKQTSKPTPDQAQAQALLPEGAVGNVGNYLDD
jgi:hypothetical protein